MHYSLTKTNPEQNQNRFYRLHIMNSLLHDLPYSVVREWGRAGSSGTVKVDFFQDEQQAIQFIEKLKQQKLQKGYILTTIHPRKTENSEII